MDVQVSDAKHSYHFAYWLVGAIVSAPSIVSFVQNEFEFGLVPAFANALEYYREVARALAFAVRLEHWPMISELSTTLRTQVVDSLPIGLVAAGIAGRSTFPPNQKYYAARNASVLIPYVLSVVVGLGAVGMVLALASKGYGLIGALWWPALISLLAVLHRTAASARSRPTYAGDQVADMQLYFRDTILLFAKTTAASVLAVIVFYVANRIAQ